MIYCRPGSHDASQILGRVEMHLQVLAANRYTPRYEDVDSTDATFVRTHHRPPSLFFVDSRSILHEGLRMTWTNIPMLISFFVQDAPRVHKEEMGSTSSELCLVQTVVELSRLCVEPKRRLLDVRPQAEANIAARTCRCISTLPGQTIELLQTSREIYCKTNQ
jgi:hypothetical protein